MYLSVQYRDRLEQCKVLIRVCQKTAAACPVMQLKVLVLGEFPPVTGLWLQLS